MTLTLADLLIYFLLFDFAARPATARASFVFDFLSVGLFYQSDGGGF